MRHKAGSLLLLALIAGLLGSGRGTAQPAPPADAGEPEVIESPPRALETMPPPPGPLLPADPAALFPPAPGYGPPVSDLIPPDDPLLVPPGQRPGWFLDAAVGVVKPHLKTRFDTGPDGPSVGSAPLDWTALPTLGAGYRLGRGAGSLRAEYSFVNSQGGQALPNFDAAGAGLLRSRLAVNRVDFAYFTSEYLLNPPADALHSQWGGLGLSVADVFFDSQAHGQQVLLRRASNNFAGVGPSLCLGFTKFFTAVPVAVYGQTNMTYYLGKVRQHFGETDRLADGSLASTTSSTGPRSDGVGVFGAEAGLRYVPGWYGGRLGFSAGYQWQRWWYVGNTDDSKAELTFQGLFLRSQFQY